MPSWQFQMLYSLRGTSYRLNRMKGAASPEVTAHRSPSVGPLRNRPNRTCGRPGHALIGEERGRRCRRRSSGTTV